MSLCQDKCTSKNRGDAFGFDDSKLCDGEISGGVEEFDFQVVPFTSSRAPPSSQLGDDQSGRFSPQPTLLAGLAALFLAQCNIEVLWADPLNSDDFAVLQRDDPIHPARKVMIVCDNQCGKTGVAHQCLQGLKHIA